ncbi:MAG: sodium:proton antiporter [Gammaproteobacteria bacterium]|nr:sodium:proton antiporter [Gammaproteobacteria bacterium]
MVRHLFVLLLLTALGTLFFALQAGFSPDSELNQVGRYYASHTAQDLGAANIVTAIIVTYRGLDTLGEVTVLFLASTIIGMVLSKGMQKGGKVSDLPPAGELLSTGSRLLVPLILLLGCYVFINGHLTPGGGFQGGAILASAALMLLLADPLRPFNSRFIAVVESTSGLLYVVIGVLGIFVAGGFLDNRILPLGSYGTIFSAGAIPIIYTLIGLKVGAEFSSMLLKLSKTEER